MVLTALTIFGKRELHQGKTTPRLGITKTQKMIKEVHCILKALLQYMRRHETNHSNKNHQTARTMKGEKTHHKRVSSKKDCQRAQTKREVNQRDLALSRLS